MAGAARKVVIPAAAALRLQRMLEERTRLERARLRAVHKGAHELAAHVRQTIAALGVERWTIRDHARVMRPLRAAGRAFGEGVTREATDGAVDAARLGVAHGPRALAAVGGVMLGRRVAAPVIDVATAERVAIEHVIARTHDVGARAGEDVAQLAVALSYGAARAPEPPSAYAVGAAVGAAVLARAKDRGERVIITELVAGAGLGGEAARVELGRRMPIRKVFDATLDRRVCSTCAGLHHLVVDANDTFDGYDDPPVHVRCRCASLPWLDDWSVLLDDLGVGPGPRTGVVGAVETQLPSFGTTLQ